MSIDNDMKKRMKILLVEPISCEALIELKKKFDVFVEILPHDNRLLKVIENKDIIILKSRVKLDRDVILAAKNLKLVAMAGIGVDHICVDELKARGIAWFNLPYLSARDVAEFTLGMIFSLARKICLADSLLRKNQWKKSELIGISLRNRTLGIIGYGEIAKETCALAKCLGMKIQIYVRNREHKKFEDGVTPVAFSDLLSSSDIISIHVPLTEQTRGMFSEPEFGLMKDNALLINTSRGGIVNEKALYKALKSRSIGGAAIDVFEKERQYNRLFELDNVVVTPHIAAMTQEAQEQIGIKLVNKIFEFFSHEENTKNEKSERKEVKYFWNQC